MNFDIGVIESVDQLNKPRRLSTKLNLWIPRPTDILHTVGVFFSLHNARSRVFTRIPREDLLLLTEQFSRAYLECSEALDTAVQYLEAIQAADKAVFDDRTMQRLTNSFEDHAGHSAKPHDEVYLLSDDHPDPRDQNYIEEIPKEEN